MRRAAPLLLAHAAAGGYIQLNGTRELCADQGYDTVTSARDCKKAAKALGLKNPSGSYNVGTTGLLFRGATPYGCYYEKSGLLTKGLWFNPDRGTTSDGSPHNDWPICKTPEPGTYAIRPGLHRIKSFDGTELSADSETPVSRDGGEKFPLVIFINSWDMPQIEYLVKTIEWARSGYICLEYQARGWYLSGGKIGTAGPDDQQDVSAVIDWALAKWPQADPTRIAVGGISYGGGIAMLSGQDPRVKAILALSGWSDLLGALYWHESPSLEWGEILVLGGQIPFVGHEPQELKDLWSMLLNHRNMSYVTSWSGQRSAKSILDTINKNAPAVYISHNHGDNLFHSSLEVDMWQRLTTPKHLDLSQGTHASAEIFGLLALKAQASNHIWGNAKGWVDHYLKGEDNFVGSLPAVQVQLGNDGLAPGYVSFSSWGAGVEERDYALGPRTDVYGTMTQGAGNGGTQTDEISFSARGDRLRTGIVLVSDALKEVVPIKAELADVPPDHAVVYATDAVGPARVCGVPRVSNLWATPDTGVFQVVVYLYSMDPSTDAGRLITHGVATLWDAAPGQPYQLPAIDMHTCCFDVPEGHALALGLDLHDTLYKPASTNVSITIDYSTHGAPKVTVPLATV